MTSSVAAAAPVRAVNLAEGEFAEPEFISGEHFNRKGSHAGPPAWESDAEMRRSMGVEEYLRKEAEEDDSDDF